MNYYHSYHAGNAADVFKHTVLLVLLESYKEKTKPFCYVDLYAGAGVYDLRYDYNKEWQDGVRKIQTATLKHPVLQKYQQLVANPQLYPGSPALAQKSLRTDDMIIAVEKNDSPYQFLKQYFYHDKQVHVHHSDAQTAVKSLLPPILRRGIVLLDPPYEDINEFSQLVKFTAQTLNRWSTACYLLWYPIKNRATVSQFHKMLQQIITQEMLAIEFCTWPDDVPARLNGSGLIMINPPWQFASAIQPMLEELLPLLKQHAGAKQQIIPLTANI